MPRQTTVTARREHMLADVKNAYISGIVELYTVFDLIRVPGIAVFNLPTAVIREIIVAVATRPNALEQLTKARKHTHLYLWIYCCLPAIRDLKEFDQLMWSFARYDTIPVMYKPLFNRMGLSYRPLSVSLDQLITGHTCLYIDSMTLPFVRNAVLACMSLPDEIVHMILAITWGLRITSRELEQRINIQALRRSVICHAEKIVEEDSGEKEKSA